MTGLREVLAPAKDIDTLELILGPTGEHTEKQLEVAWKAHREEVMANLTARSAPGFRPWAYWKFELGEERPDDRDRELIRLAELGLLRDDEIATVTQRANEARARIGTPAEHVLWPSGSADADTVELYEAVKRAARTGARQPQALTSGDSLGIVG